MSDEEMKQNAMNILAYRQIGLIEATDTLYNTIQEMLNHIDKLEKSNKEWFDIADNILRATNKYGKISIGEVVDYIDKMQKENEELEKQLIEKNIIPLFNYIDKQDKIIHKMAEIIALNTCEKKLIGRNLEERIDIVIEDIKKCISK